MNVGNYGASRRRRIDATGGGMRVAALLLCVGAACCAPSDGVKNDQPKGVLFETITDAVWTIPEHGRSSRVAISLKITNGSDEALRFRTFDTITIAIEAPDGRRLLMDGGRDGTRPGSPHSDPVPPGGEWTVDRTAKLMWTSPENLRLQGDDGFGGIWYIDGLSKGPGFLEITYENRITRGADRTRVWTGKGDAPPVEIRMEDSDEK